MGVGNCSGVSVVPGAGAVCCLRRHITWQKQPLQVSTVVSLIPHQNALATLPGSSWRLEIECGNQPKKQNARQFSQNE